MAHPRAVARVHPAGGEDHPAQPLPMLPVAQLYERDIPGMPGPEGKDVLQVFWCGFTGHTDGHESRKESATKWVGGV